MPIQRTVLPTTDVPWHVSFAGLIGMLAGVGAALILRDQPTLALIVLITLTAAPMWWIEARRHKSATETSPISTVTRSRRTWRLYGLAVGAMMWVTTLHLLPLAHGPVIYGFFQVLEVCWPLLLAGLVVSVLRSTHCAPHGLELVGRWIQLRPVDERFPWHALRDQLVKAFFFPLMLGFAYDWATDARPWGSLQAPRWYFISMAALYLIDTVFATVGYLSTSRRLGAEIRSSNPYWLGWAAALICYPPFFTWLQQSGFNYRDGHIWSDWLTTDTPLYYAWGSSILILSAIYALSTVVFGIRFSNLTHRGIITHGPYRLTKHPAYISKNLSWWLISIPFVSNTGVATALMHCGILLCINGIYWMRAKTEERHLMADPKYRDYATWIAEHGAWAQLTRKLVRQ
ncbi:MAG TPA: DUF1295 domain-containing protein [Pseudoxanthomonas sp.]|nr:DUF1295 domain-containing protein [Pseudoxanthomonas sp.]